MNIIFTSAFFSITEEQLEDYESAYPGVNVPQELRKMDLWLRINPKRRKRSYSRFVTNWLSRVHRQLLEIEVRENVRLNHHRKIAMAGAGPEYRRGA